jgi:saposin
MIIVLTTLCFSAARAPRPRNVKLSAPSASSCKVCETLLTHLEPLVFKDISESGFIVEANKACQQFAPSFAIACRQLVSMNAAELRLGLRSGKDVKSTCSLVGFCGVSTVSKLSRTKISGLPAGIFCDVCQDLVSYVEELLFNETLLPDIEILVGDICNLLPSPLSSLCTSFIDQYLEEIIADIEADIDSFNICGKIGLCGSRGKKPVLRRSLLHGKGDVFCDLCEELIDYIRQLYIDGYAKEEIEELVNELCQSLGPFSSLCTSFLDGYIDEIFDWIDQELDSATICGFIGLCGSNPGISKKQSKSLVRVSRVKSTKAIPNDIFCDGCKEVIDYIRTMLIDGYAKEAIEEAVAELCQALGPLASLCTSYIDSYIDDIFAWIDQGLDSTTICSDIGLCSRPPTKSVRRVSRTLVKKGMPQDIFCDLCEELIDYVRQLLIDGYAKEEIEALVNDLCNSLPSPLSSLCTSIADQYIDQIFDWIDQELDSATICGFIGLCSSGKSSAVQKSVRVPVKAARGNFVGRLPGDIFCDLCQDLISYIEELVINGFIEEEIEALVLELCNGLPSPFNTFCTSLIDKEIENILNWIDQQIDSLNICGFIGLCSTNSKKLNIVRIRHISKKTASLSKHSLPSGFFCDICQELIQEIEQLVLEDFVKADIESIVADLCNSLPSPFSSLCTSYIDQYIDEIIAGIESDIDSWNLCGQIGLCSHRSSTKLASRVGSKHRNGKSAPSGIFCDVCQEIVGYVEQLVLEGFIQADIEALVDDICRNLPSPFDSLCASTIDQYVDEIIVWIEQGIDSFNICGKIGLCSAKSRKLALKRPSQVQNRKSIAKTIPGGILCDSCGSLVKSLEGSIVDGTVKSDFAALIGQICGELPSPLSGLCRSYLDQYVDEIIGSLESGVESSEICAKIGLCSSTLKVSKSVKQARVVSGGRPVIRAQD